MISKGNLPAKTRLSELQDLRQLLEEAKETNQEHLKPPPQILENMPTSEDTIEVKAPDMDESNTLENTSLDLLDWIERSAVDDLYPQPQDLTNIADSLGSWDSMDWLSNYSGF